MEWKQIFKPTLFQIIVFLLLFFIVPYISPCKHVAVFTTPENLGKVSWSMCQSDSLLILMPGYSQTDTAISMWGLLKERNQIFNLPIFIILIYILSLIIKTAKERIF
jgi:hypothetical protein